MLRYAVPDELIWDLEENSSRIITDTPYRYFNDFAHLFEGGQHTNGADVSQPTVPPAPGTVSALHPLLSRNSGDNVFAINNPQNQYNSSSILPRNFRNSRQRLSRISTNQIPQVPSTITFGNFGALNAPAHSISINPQHNWQQPLGGLHHPNNNAQHSNTPVILQRLLGTQTHNFLQLTRSIQPARLVFTSNDYQVFANQGNWNDTQMGPESNDSSMLNSITTAITRWTEESKVLDGDSIQDCVAGLKQDIISVWEKYRDEEMNERKEKRKELIEKERKRDLLRAEIQKQEQQSAAKSDTVVITSASNLIEGPASPDQPPSITTDTAANLIEDQSQQEQLESQAESNETERMETQPSVIDSENTEDNQPTTQNDQDEDVIEMTCSETISTEQEMEIANPTQNQNEINNEETAEPNNTVEIATNQQSTTEQQVEGATASSSQQPIQESSSTTANSKL